MYWSWKIVSQKTKDGAQSWKVEDCKWKVGGQKMKRGGQKEWIADWSWRDVSLLKNLGRDSLLLPS